MPTSAPGGEITGPAVHAALFIGTAEVPLGVAAVRCRTGAPMPGCSDIAADRAGNGRCRPTIRIL